jgi:hypothetical protein
MSDNFVIVAPEYKHRLLNGELIFTFQDPTKQAEIDNFMVQQLDGTSNDWGWCKQKVLKS